jgi:mannose-6-phosphate isomerase-like protein (cupin superfamily)
MTAQPGEARGAGWPWRESLDALTAAPQHHALLLETEDVRVLETRIPPGERVPVHTHRWPSVLYVLSWSDYLRCDENGKLVADSRVAGDGPPTVMWSPPLPPHSLENVGATEIRVISVELKQVAG